jgi:hypothetical protein
MLGDSDNVSNLTIKEVFMKCLEKFCSINGALIGGRLVDDKLFTKHAMLAQAETKTKVPFANRNGKQDKSNGSDPQVAKIKKELILSQ